MAKRLRREEAQWLTGIQTIVWLDSLEALPRPGAPGRCDLPDTNEK